MRIWWTILSGILLFAVMAMAGESPLQQVAFFAASPYMTMAKMAATEQAVNTLAEKIVTKKSKGKAFLYSLLLPGLGERYAGAPGKAEYFFGAEIALWLWYSGFDTFGGWRTEEYQNYAAAHAGIDPRGKPFMYYVNIGYYNNMDEFNAAKLRQRNLPAYYNDAANDWQWDSSANREKFNVMRKAAVRAERNATLVLGAIFANHLISAIDAVITTQKYNRGLSSSMHWQLQFGDGNLQPSISFSLVKHF